MNDLDRILLADVGPQPTADFSRRVMTTVRAEGRAGGLSRTWLLVLTGLFVVFVGLPLLIVTAEGFQRLSGEGLSGRFFWMLGLLVITSIAAVLPLQFLEG